MRASVAVAVRHLESERSEVVERAVAKQIDNPRDTQHENSQYHQYIGNRVLREISEAQYLQEPLICLFSAQADGGKSRASAT